MSIKKTRWQRPLLGSVVALSLLVGCDDSDSPEGGKDASTTEDGSVKKDAETDQEDAEVADGGVDGGDIDGSTTPDAAVDASEPDAAVPPEKLKELFAGKVALSTTEADRFWTATFTSDNKILAAGFVTTTDAAKPGIRDTRFAVARFGTDGALDKTFGDVDPSDATKRTGIATVNVEVAGDANVLNGTDAEDIRGIGVQKDGKIVVAGTYRYKLLEGTYMGQPAKAGESNVAIARFNADGTRDTAFGTGNPDAVDGVIKFGIGEGSFNGTGTNGATTTANDSVGDLRVDSQDRVVLFAAGRTTSTDTDRVIYRFSKDGVADGSFDTDGKVVYDTVPPAGGTKNENAHIGNILADDGIISTGYTNPGADYGNHRMVIVKLDNEGKLVSSFGNPGATYYNPFPNEAEPKKSGVAESYAVAVQSDGKLVTTGYGRPTSTGLTGANSGNVQSAVISIRFDAEGKRDTSYGETQGYTIFNQADGAATSETGPEQGRNAITLADDSVIMVGNATPVTGNGNGVVLHLTKDGKFGNLQGGKSNKTYDFGLPADALWGLAISKDKKYVVASGFAAGGADPTKEDSALVIYEVK